MMKILMTMLFRANFDSWRLCISNGTFFGRFRIRAELDDELSEFSEQLELDDDEDESSDIEDLAINESVCVLIL